MIRPTSPLRSGAVALAAGLFFAASSPLTAQGLVSGVETLRIAGPATSAVELPLEPGVRFGSLTPVDGGWVAAGVRDDEALLLLRSGAAGAAPERIVTPPAGGHLVAAPQAVAGDGDLRGLVWLAGTDDGAFGVRFAPWHGDGWGPVETVAPPGPGSQLAPAAVSTGDGEILLLWSAFDGTDDEILWSRRAGGAWTEPARIAPDNAVPDITPTVTVVAGEAVAAWSRYDAGEYRLVASRLADGRWTTPTPVGGPGTLFPRFEPLRDGGDEALLVFRDAARDGWTVLRLDRTLRPRARASVAGGSARRPAVLGATDEGVELILGPDREPRRVPWSRLP